MCVHHGTYWVWFRPDWLSQLPSPEPAAVCQRGLEAGAGRAMQEVLLQLTTGSAFRPKRPATTSAVREQEGPSAALHELMESCWHQVGPGQRLCLDVPQPSMPFALRGSTTCMTSWSAGGTRHGPAGIRSSQPCPLPCVRERNAARFSLGPCSIACTDPDVLLWPFSSVTARQDQPAPCRTRCTAPPSVTSRLTWQPSQPRWRVAARSPWSCGMHGRGSCWTRCCPPRCAATGHA